MLEKARHLLFDEYIKCCEAIKSDRHYTHFAQEKMHHSLQVLGAGNYIIKHEPYFGEKTAEFIEIAKTAVLLHDVARFDEIIGLCRYGRRTDHGVDGYKKLCRLAEYDHDLIALPIKHHGHVKEDFYNDETFKQISDRQTIDDCEHIFWLIRDADKIANFNIVCAETAEYLPLFIPSFSEATDHSAQISPEVLTDFLRLKTVDRSLPKTRADSMLTFISWFFDINYQSSIVFCQKLNLIGKMFDLLRSCHQDNSLNDSLEKTVNDYLYKKFG